MVDVRGASPTAIETPGRRKIVPMTVINTNVVGMR
jgi:hypothetical protein